MGRYLAIVHSVPDDIDPINFWVQQEKDYPLLASLAVDLLSIPGTLHLLNVHFPPLVSHPVGNGIACLLKIWRELLLRKNKAYL